MNKRLIYALPATVLALVALGLAIVGLLSTQDQPANAGQAKVSQPEQTLPAPEYQYLVARQALSPGDVMTEEGFMSVASSDPLPDAIPADDAPYGQPIKTSLAAGQMLTTANMRIDSVLETLVPHGHQAMAIAVDDVSGVGGLLRPGDRVDVTASFRRSDKDKPAALKLLGNVLVLAVKGVPFNGEAGEESDSRRNNTVVLSVPEDKVSRLLLASSEGKLQLVAVPPKQEVASEDEEPEVKPVYLEDLFPKPPKPEPAPRATPPPSTRVQVFEGSESRSVYVR
ncbi:Flp pilus assembly protein CpaB [Marinobacter sp. NP-4(2019)]|uniref:Flp pilus assembly protein CpaB n=1 Tax=Marinobacter sp. NP-4(2019) TaxID=2488665 RepID=UPI000FC3D915|nr:Flp pilus assembly protein CpaB [Marinobacter sp. NP-4(2019)]AZT82389.1 Flp pilus assembly protein CpaB [Marinobacter sp. NP-4(2019)]